MMLEFLGWQREASAFAQAVKSALLKNYLTSDLGGDKNDRRSRRLARRVRERGTALSL